MATSSLVWLRQDLRLDDQPAIAAAAGAGPFAALYVLDDETPGAFGIGAAQRWWLHHSLERLGSEMEKRGGTLILRRGKSVDIVSEVAAHVNAGTIHATRHYEPWWQASERALGNKLVLHPADTLIPLEEIKTSSGEPYRIYSPFYRKLSSFPVDPPSEATHRLKAPARLPPSDELTAWNLLPSKPDWASGFSVWRPGEEEARSKLKSWKEKVASYAHQRDLPSLQGTSELSPFLHFGEISPRRIWHALAPVPGSEKFLKELAWRDFARSAVLADPKIGVKSQRSIDIAWRSGSSADADFEAWTRGETGYPIVDAGMRQLWKIGWMHNRVRMIAASFLVKHLLIDWRRGERWFWDTLVDADYGNNSLNWQWIAGTGVDSQPFNRIMAPIGQSRKFDAGDYIRRWVPELAALADDLIHDPPSEVAGYPQKLVGHLEARERALSARQHG
ncbi:MAG TPA: deoxyribodipyrimidine photo-lyase [Sphingomicrobium sp.]